MAASESATEPIAAPGMIVFAPSSPPGESDVARQRREQVIEAAIEIIATRGLHRLSLSEIETKTGMARGHLTYYFPHKEDILLAVFDRMLYRMIEQSMRSGGPRPGSGQAWECLKFILARKLQTPANEQMAFGSLLHTFLAQIGHRDDYRAKLAARNEEWRTHMGADFAASVPDLPAPSRELSSVVMALIQGLTQQLAVDPNAFDREAMYTLLLSMLAPYFRANLADAPTRLPDHSPTGEVQ